LPAPAPDSDPKRAGAFGGKLQPAGICHGEAADLGDDTAKTTTAQPLLETGEQGFFIPRLDINNAIRGQARLRNGGRKQILPCDTPQHLSGRPCDNPGRKQGGRGAINRAVAAASDLMQRAHCKSAAWQPHIQRRQAKWQNARGRPPSGLHQPNFFAQ
jgi:hypothetical protein